MAQSSTIDAALTSNLTTNKRLLRSFVTTDNENNNFNAVVSAHTNSVAHSINI